MIHLNSLPTKVWAVNATHFPELSFRNENVELKHKKMQVQIKKAFT